MSVLAAWAVVGLFFFAVIMLLISIGQDVRRKRIRHRLYDYNAE